MLLSFIWRLDLSLLSLILMVKFYNISGIKPEWLKVMRLIILKYNRCKKGKVKNSVLYCCLCKRIYSVFMYICSYMCVCIYIRKLYAIIHVHLRVCTQTHRLLYVCVYIHKWYAIIHVHIRVCTQTHA